MKTEKKEGPRKFYIVKADGMPCGRSKWYGKKCGRFLSISEMFRPRRFMEAGHGKKCGRFLSISEPVCHFKTAKSAQRAITNTHKFKDLLKNSVIYDWPAASWLLKVQAYSVEPVLINFA